MQVNNACDCTKINVLIPINLVTLSMDAVYYM